MPKNDIIEGGSEIAGPSGVNNNQVARKPKPNMVKVVIADKEVDLSLEPSLDDCPDETVGVDPGPIKVSARRIARSWS